MRIAHRRAQTEAAAPRRDSQKVFGSEGAAELNAMLGMEWAKREIKLIKSTTKMSLARARMGLPVSVPGVTPCCWGRPVPAKPGAGVHQAVQD